MTTLLDANVLVALTVGDHVHHRAAERWLAAHDSGFATCPMTQGSLVRLLLRQGQAVAAAKTLLGTVAADPRHEFWPDSLSFSGVNLAGVAGHRQVTDAYLANLARSHNGRLATFDRGLAGLHGDVTDLLSPE